jgi:hypothetical protein
LNKKIGRFLGEGFTGAVIRGYDQGTVQPGAAMTVKEMGAGDRSRSPALFISDFIQAGPARQKGRPLANRPGRTLFGLSLASFARPHEDKSLAFALLEPARS